ncbi:MAG: DEAD/DEAH box helicase family protein [Saprospiraceae bacterium]|nr:DEAD/DEAH box helicase family protein [Candidatus Opimibacter iunctus]
MSSGPRQVYSKLFEEVSGSEKQTSLMLSYLAIAGKEFPAIDPKEILARAEVGKSVIQTLIQKGIFKEMIKEVNRMDRYGKAVEDMVATFTPIQKMHLQIHHHWKDKEVVLLHGVTGSGKTIIYTEIIQEVINDGGQVLYLVPEIGMSVQLLHRLKQCLDRQITISHSRFNENERVDVWNQVLKSEFPLSQECAQGISFLSKI